MPTAASPINEKNRLVWIDAARGFAIFGIFIVNILGFSAPYFLYGGAEDVWTSPIDQFIQAIIDIFFQASFYTLFSFLFGFSIQLMTDRLAEKNIAFYMILLRRLIVLIGFGFIHSFLLWHGDILLSYGIIGLLLLFFLQVRSRTILMWGMVLLSVTVGLFTLLLYQVRDHLDWYSVAAVSQAFENYQESSLLVILSQNYNDWVYANGGIAYLPLAGILLPLFLFGMYAARQRIFHEPKKHLSLLKRLWYISFVLFIAFKLGPYFYGNPTWFSYIQDNIGGTASAIFYLLSITIMAQTELGKKLIKPFIYVGRMALTNYVFQSVISFTLFYGVGFGLYGSVSPTIGVVIVMIVFIFQVFFSKWWFQRFRFGPLEWVWRTLTYLKKQPLRKVF
ncbi:DUF418 domain-containing protein [Virgibacillus oceani]